MSIQPQGVMRSTGSTWDRSDEGQGELVGWDVEEAEN